MLKDLLSYRQNILQIDYDPFVEVADCLLAQLKYLSSLLDPLRTVAAVETKNMMRVHYFRLW